MTGQRAAAPLFPDKVLLDICVEILKRYRLAPDGIHGVSHWGRVLANGTQLAALTGAKARVVQLFALFQRQLPYKRRQRPRTRASRRAISGGNERQAF